ncbi:hypothetical protein H5410_021787 [Solanum commersonii]|uniref:Reverse transcriptase domain-containing protein n=1 Tax=Solanum commersonii TaxID=4109 RepID=A0A9J5ZCY2_SOLCO|nr:hypothetical protein H5410_021787 [Solanum commersonii]
MKKAYDRVSWFYLMKVLRKISFSEVFDDIIWRIIANNCAEVLSKGSNSLFYDDQYVGYGMPKWSANLNNFSYEDDTIIFAAADENSLKIIMKVLGRYESQLGQLINKGKSAWYMHQNTSVLLRGISRGQFQITYLGCPITHAKKRMSDLIKKNIFLARVEGGLGFRSLFDVFKAMFESYGGNLELDIREMMNDEGWDSGKIQQALLEKITGHVQEHLRNFILPSPEIVQHIFLTWEIAREVCNHFANFVGLTGPWIKIKHCTEVEKCFGNEKFKTIMKAKSRNIILYGSFYPVEKKLFWRYVVVKGKRLLVSTNLFAEALAIKEGIQLKLDINLLPLIVETNSLTMINILEERWEVPWSVAMEVETIKIMREDTYMVENFQDLPMRAKKLINMDEMNMPHLRLSLIDN